MSAEWHTLRTSAEGVVLLDQRRLPSEEIYRTCTTVEEVATAIEDMVVRGAPAIACTAALGVALAARSSQAASLDELVADVEAAAVRLARTRPTAANLFWALERMRACLNESAEQGDMAAVRDAVVREADRILVEDVAANRALGAAGVGLIPEVPGGARVLTHCNAGALATAGYGTALGVIRSVIESGRKLRVLAGETRPFLQGARLTAWELMRDGVPVTVLTDGMAGYLMGQGEVDVVLVGADRIAANGDVANKIGTYSLAVLAREHRIPFYVAAPLSTVDLATPDGAAIPIEERSPDEVLHWAGTRLAPDGVSARHPAFDVTPARLVTAIITESGIARFPYSESLAAFAS
ncbi:MAG: S-methyl-5-thioribose-1-phosphate isomerase [Myxococcota bacterium]|nr:S-methyl-5-thioribose-1-phosphate isomerase [Myxococcota bacterium]